MISKEEVIHIAKLARLELSETEIEKMQKDLSSILDYFDLLKKAEKPTSQSATKALDIEKVTRKDVVREYNANLANDLIQAAPDRKEGYIKVKSIL